MIRPIKIKLNAAHPELPLVEATTFVGSPSTVFVSDVPKAVGSWRISTVKVVATYPDNSAPTVECVKGADGVYVATIPATATSGRVANGLQIIADGIDERGEAVTGYVLGMADFAVFTRDMTIESGGTVWYMHYFDAVPQMPKKGDVAPDGSGGLQFYNGNAWQPFAVVPPIQYPVTSVNGQTGAVTLTPSDVGALPTSGTVDMGTKLTLDAAQDVWYPLTVLRILTNGLFAGLEVAGREGSNPVDIGPIGITVGNRKYLFPGNTMPPYSYETSDGTLALLANTMRFSTQVSYVVGDVVFHDGAFYRCTTAHTAGGTWDASHFEVVIGGLSTGTPTAPNLTAQSADGQVANKKYVDDAVGAIKTFQHDAGGYYIEVEAS